MILYCFCFFLTECARGKYMERTNHFSEIFSGVAFHSCTYADQVNGPVSPPAGAELALLFVLRGCVRCVGVQARRSEILVTPARHAMDCDAAEYYAVWMRCIDGTKPDSPLCERPQDFDRLLLQAIQLMYYSSRDRTGSRLTFELLLQELLKTRNLHKSARNQNLEKAFLWIEQNYRRNYSLEELAGALGYVPSYFCRMFRKNTGMTPGEYQSSLRIRDACIRLAETDDVVSVIADELGYSSDKHFMTVFKRHMKVTPTQYRSAYRR